MIFVNGRQIDVPDGASVAVLGNKVYVNGQAVEGEPVGGVLTIKVESPGGLGFLHAERGNVELKGDVRGNVQAGGSVNVSGSVGGSVDAGGSANCGPVQGDLDAGGSVSCGAVGGSVNAGGNVVMRR